MDTISLSATTVFAGGLSTVTPTVRAYFSLNSDGTKSEQKNNDPQISLGDWCTPHADAHLYEARATVTSGTLSSGTAGSWLDLASSRTWEKETSVNGIFSAIFTLEIRRKSDHVGVASASITLTVSRSS